MLEAEEAEENPDSEISKHELVIKVLTGLLSEERFLSFLCIRKGKVSEMSSYLVKLEVVGISKQLI